MKPLRSALTVFLFCLLAQVVSGQTIQTVLPAYYSVKDALVASDAARARKEAGSLLLALTKVSSSKLPEADQEALEIARVKAAALNKTTNLTEQRELFDDLSKSLIQMARTTKPGKTFVQFCPMAADGKGASWLSDKKEIRNPYYGSKMLTCGKVTAEI